MSKSNSIAIQFYNYKVEFQLSGAGHIHGVLWTDWQNFKALFKEDTENVKEALKNEKEIETPERESISKFAHLFCLMFPLKILE